MMRGKVAAAAAFGLFVAGMADGAVTKRALKGAERPSLAQSIDCGAHRFEATIHLTGSDGNVHDQLVRMCGMKGESDAEWIVTLKDAVRKTASSSQMPETAKEQIIAAVNAEISRLSLPGLGLPPGTDITKLPKSAPARAAQAPLSQDYSALPPLPTGTTVPPPNLLSPNGAMAQEAHLTLRCALVGDEDRADSCDTLSKDTVLVLRADEAYPRGLAVHFVRHGNERGRVDLPSMSAGETRTFRLPAAACAGVVRSTLEIDAGSASGPVDASPAKVGEYDLRC
jgi:hypothetical protein